MEKSENELLSLYEICQDCGARCCIEPASPVIFPEELERIRKHLNRNGLNDHITKKSEGIYIIPRLEKGCPYLKEGRCVIQDVKPLDCRIFPVGLDRNSEIGISDFCPAKELLTPSYKKETKKLLRRLSAKQKKALAGANEVEGYWFFKKPSKDWMQLLISLYGCNPKTLKSRESLVKYCKDVVSLVGMKAVGEPIVQEKYGGKIFHGHSLIQFIETSSVLVHVLEPLLGASIDIYSCRKFDIEKASRFTKNFFKARKIVSKVVQR